MAEGFGGWSNSPQGLPGWRAPGLYVPKRIVSERGLEGTKRLGRFESHLGRYLTSAEYLPAYLNSRGDESIDTESYISLILKKCDRQQLLLALTVATWAAQQGGQALDNWQNYVLERLDPELVAFMLAALQPAEKADRGVILARQPVLAALRRILDLPPSPAGKEGGLDPFVVVTLLSHFVANDLSADADVADHAEIGGFPADLAIELVQNTIFNSADDFGDLLARNWLFWNEYQGRLLRYPPRASLDTMLSEACGLTLEELMTCAFAIYAQAIQAEVPQHGALDLSSINGLISATVAKFLQRFSSSIDELAGNLGQPTDRWYYLGVEDRPLIRLSDSSSVAVIDIALFQRRFTTAVYWLIHDSERDHHGNSARIRWTQTYSELVEIYAEDMLRAVSPTIIGSGSTFFTEEQLALLGGSAADCGIDFGPFVLVADIVQHHVTISTRAHGSLEGFASDMKKMVIKKAKQIDGSITQLLNKASHPDHPIGRRPDVFLPAVVQGGAFPVSPVTVNYCRDQATAEGLLQQPECLPLIVLTLDEIEMLDPVSKATGQPVGSLLESYSRSGATNSFGNFIVDEYSGLRLKRSGRGGDALSAIFEVVINNLDHSDGGAING